MKEEGVLGFWGIISCAAQGDIKALHKLVIENI